MSKIYSSEQVSRGHVDTFAVKPDRLVDLKRLLVLRHGGTPPFSVV